jgi:hypothetical protein
MLVLIDEHTKCLYIKGEESSAVHDIRHESTFQSLFIL